MADDTQRLPEEWVNANWLAHLADITSPDSMESVGAVRLRMVAADVFDQLRYNGEPEDIAQRAADVCVPIYTHERWQTFVDLGAYQEDISDLVGSNFADVDGLTGAAGVALYVMFERLAAALVADWDARLPLAASEATS